MKNNIITEYIETHLDKYDFDDGLISLLETLPVERKSVNYLLASILEFDIFELYFYLIKSELRGFLIDEEYAFVANRFRHIFDPELHSLLDM